MHRAVRTGRRPVRATVAAPPPADIGLHLGATAPYAPLPPADVERLIEAALTLMHEGGVGFEAGSEACAILRAAGCTVSADGVVRFPPPLVRDALAATGKSVKLWDRSATRAIDLDCDHTWFIPGMTCIKVFDLDSGAARASTAEDLATIARLADALPNIDAVCIPCKNVARSDIHGEIEEFAIMAANTVKPLEYLCENAASLEVVIDMAAAIRGSHEALAAKPYFLQIITPLPLNYYSIHTDQLIRAVRAGVPVSVGTLPIGGASTPITTAGSIANSLATDFAAMVLAQQVRRGAFCIGSSDVCFMEPATGSIGNFAQTLLADMIMCQIRRSLGLPSFTGAAGYSDARRFNADSIAEVTASLTQTFFTRPATLDYLGSLDQGLTYSMHSLVYCDDLAGLLRAMWEGVRVNEDTLALDIARAIGPRGNYLAQQHTVDHCREHLWKTRFFGPNLPLSSDTKPDEELPVRVDRELRRLLAEHRPPPLEPALAERLRTIRERFAASYAG